MASEMTRRGFLAGANAAAGTVSAGGGYSRRGLCHVRRVRT